ncbi:MAG: hypothetical protein JRE43_10495 [Deltaproteobacteria bacterium]|jgi:hypothetical protein|nr:hypothetical protein [Deltaproteobacteria bacterium]
MREKPGFEVRAGGSKDLDVEQVRTDLEELGIDPEFSGPVAQRLVAIAPGLTAAYSVHRDRIGPNDLGARRGNELRRLMEGCTSELRKLDEGLQMLSAYLLRMCALASREGSGNLH